MPQVTTRSLNGVWGSTRGDVWAVGNAGTILYDGGTVWSILPATNLLFSAWANSATEAFFVGLNGLVYQYLGGSFASSNPTAQPLLGVWGTSTTNVFAVGGAGTILRYTGTWNPMTSGTANQLNAVGGSSGTDVYAVGAMGTIVRYNGSMWTAMTSGTTSTLRAVWARSASEAYAGGDGVLLRYNGTSWSPVTVPRLTTTPLTIRGIWGASTGPTVYAVGLDGLILRFDGTSWRAMGTQTSDHLYAVWGSSDSDVVAVGRAGTVLHYDGRAWAPQVTTTTDDLFTVHGVASGAAFAAGGQILANTGTIAALHRSTIGCGTGEQLCNDYNDNDCDGATDALDSDCAPMIELCGNLIDDDRDGVIDCADSSCSSFKGCKNGGVCKAASPQPITCGQTLAGDTSMAQARLTAYGCDPSLETGRETFYQFTTATPKMVTVTLSGYGAADLDLIVVGSAATGACDPIGQCIGASSTTNATEQVTFSAAAGATYHLVVEGYRGASGPFTSLNVSCL